MINIFGELFSGKNGFFFFFFFALIRVTARRKKKTEEKKKSTRVAIRRGSPYTRLYVYFTRINSFFFFARRVYYFWLVRGARAHFFFVRTEFFSYENVVYGGYRASKHKNTWRDRGTRLAYDDMVFFFFFYYNSVRISLKRRRLGAYTDCIYST